MHDELVQKGWFSSRKFSIAETGLKVASSRLGDSSSVEVPYEEISMLTYSQNKRNLFLFTLSLLLVPVLGALLVLAVSNRIHYWPLWLLSGLFLLLFILSIATRRYVTIIPVDNGSVLEFKTNIPDNNTVENFLLNFRKAQKDFLVKKYGHPDPNLPLEHQLNNLLWLRDRNIISISEYEAMKNDLTGGKSEAGPIGF